MARLALSLTLLLGSGWAAQEPPLSLAPLFTTLVEDPIEPIVRPRASRRRLTLTADNTHPIRILIDADSLLEATAPPYTACFNVGDWFRRGLPPQQTPPQDGVPTCIRDNNEYAQASTGCWGICEARDIVSTTSKQLLEDTVTAVAAEMSEFFSILNNDANLVFEISKGRYQRALLERGYTPETRCSADCYYISNTAVAESYCTDGVAADAVLSITRPPSIAGVMGTGSACVTDPTNSRPTWLTLAWMVPIDETKSLSELIDEYRGFIRHEIIHALGFSHSTFTYARDSAGQRKNMLELVELTDADGETDRIWHFKSTTRAYQAASTYFNCADPAAWHGVPLMGAPEIGRNSHWETRIMRDDVMSYGGKASVSPITLAAMEDLGFYLANYSAADCMLWGYKQGCAFVKTRCSGPPEHDSSAATSSTSDCRGDDWWTTSPKSYLQQKCALGDDPCSTNSGSGYISSGPSGPACDAQCYTPLDGRTDCSAGPPDSVEGAAGKSFAQLTEPYMQFIWLGLMVLGGIVAVVLVNRCCCPEHGSIAFTAIASTIICLFGMALAGIGGYAYFVGIELLSTFVGNNSLIGMMCIGSLLVALCMLTFIGLCLKTRCLFYFIFIMQVLMMLVQAALAGLVAYWVFTLNHVTADQIAALQGGQVDGKYDGRMGEAVLAEIEGVMCRTYTTCCRNPILDTNQTCISMHEGTTVDIAIAMKDPASPNFCPYLSGSSGALTFTPSVAACIAIDWLVPEHSTATCQSNFCSSGYEGYESFVQATVNWMLNNALIIGGVSTLVIVLQIIVAMNIYRHAKYINWKSKRLSRVNPGARTYPPPKP